MVNNKIISSYDKNPSISTGIKLVAASGLLALLTACGGGGGSDPTPPPVDPNPIELPTINVKANLPQYDQNTRVESSGNINNYFDVTNANTINFKIGNETYSAIFSNLPLCKQNLDVSARNSDGTTNKSLEAVVFPGTSFSQINNSVNEIPQAPGSDVYFVDAKTMRETLLKDSQFPQRIKLDSENFLSQSEVAEIDLVKNPDLGGSLVYRVKKTGLNGEDNCKGYNGEFDSYSSQFLFNLTQDLNDEEYTKMLQIYLNTGL